MYDESWSEFRFVSVRRFLDIKFAYKLTLRFFKIILSFSPAIRCFKANCGWYLDAAVSALRTLDRKIFWSNCKFFNEQDESTYFRQFAKMDNILFYSKLNLRRNSGHPNERTHVTVWCQIARTLDKNQNSLNFRFKKKAVCGLYPRVGSRWIFFQGRAPRTRADFLSKKKTVLTNTVRGTEVQTENSDGAGRQCMRGKLIPHHRAGDVNWIENESKNASGWTCERGAKCPPP